MMNEEENPERAYSIIYRMGIRREDDFLSRCHELLVSYLSIGDPQRCTPSEISVARRQTKNKDPHKLEYQPIAKERALFTTIIMR